MKTKILIFLIFLLANIGYTFAQDDVYNTPSVKHKRIHDENKAEKYPWKINSGFVFIDGKYMEPPYKVEQKKTGYIYINNELAQITIISTDTISNPYKQDNLPEIPKELNKNTTFTELRKLRDKASNKLLVRAVGHYYHTRYKEGKANKKIKEFYQSLPNVKLVQGSGGMLYIETYADEKGFYVDISTDFVPDMYEKYGIHSKYKLPTDKELRLKADKEVSRITDYLSQDMAIFFKKGKNMLNSYRPFPEKIFYDKVKKLYSGEISEDESRNFKYQIIRKTNKNTLEDIFNNAQLKTRIKKLDEKFNKNNNQGNRNKNIKTGQILRNKSTSTAYSPQNQNFYSWCPCANYDPEFTAAGRTL